MNSIFRDQFYSVESVEGEISPSMSDEDILTDVDTVEDNVVNEEFAPVEEVSTAIDTTSTAIQDLSNLNGFIERRESEGGITEREAEILTVATEAILKPFDGFVTVKIHCLESNFPVVPGSDVYKHNNSMQTQNSTGVLATIKRLFVGMIEFIKSFFQRVKAFLGSIFGQAARIKRYAQYLQKRNKKIKQTTGYVYDISQAAENPKVYRRYQEIYHSLKTANGDFDLSLIYSVLGGISKDVLDTVHTLESETGRSLSQLTDALNQETINVEKVVEVSEEIVDSIKKNMKPAPDAIAKRIAGGYAYDSVYYKEMLIGGKGVFVLFHENVNGVFKISVKVDTINEIKYHTIAPMGGSFSVKGHTINWGDKAQKFMLPDFIEMTKMIGTVISGCDVMIKNQDLESRLDKVSRNMDHSLNNMLRHFDGKKTELITNDINLIRSSLLNVQGIWKYVTLLIKESIAVWFTASRNVLTLCDFSMNAHQNMTRNSAKKGGRDE